MCVIVCGKERVMSESSVPQQQEETPQCKQEEVKPTPTRTSTTTMFPGSCAATLERVDVSRSSTPDTPRSPSRPVLPDDKLYCIWSEDGQLRLSFSISLFSYFILLYFHSISVVLCV